MRLLLRLVCILAGAWVISYGVDGWGINTEPKTFTIEEVEKSGVGDARFIIVTGGESTGVHIAVETYLKSDPDNKHTTGAIIPLFSRARLAEAGGDPRPATSIVYNLEGTNGCLMDKTCGQPGPVEVRGVVKRLTLWGVGTTYSTIAYPRAPNFIFVTYGEPMPEPFYLLLIFAGGVLVLLGFLPKRHFSKYVTGERR